MPCNIAFIRYVTICLIYADNPDGNWISTCDFELSDLILQIINDTIYLFYH